jgi:hypothetical protein
MNKSSGQSDFTIRMIWGLLLIGTGIVLFLPMVGISLDINWGLLWPFFLLIPGLGLWATTAVQKNHLARAGVAIPATILCGYALLFFFHAWTAWRWVGELTFLFPGVIALAFWAAWILSRRSIGFLIPAVILTFASSTTFIFSSIFRKLFIPTLLIGFGVLLIAKDLFRRREEISAQPPVEDSKSTRDKPPSQAQEPA